MGPSYHLSTMQHKGFAEATLAMMKRQKELDASQERNEPMIQQTMRSIAILRPPQANRLRALALASVCMLAGVAPGSAAGGPGESPSVPEVTTDSPTLLDLKDFKTRP